MKASVRAGAARVLADLLIVGRSLPAATAAMAAEADPTRAASWDGERGTIRHDADGTAAPTGDPVGEFVCANRGLWATHQLLTLTRRACRTVSTPGPVDAAEIPAALRRLTRNLPAHLDAIHSTAEATGRLAGLVAEWAGSIPDAAATAELAEANDAKCCWWHLRAGVKAPAHRRHADTDGGSRPACQWCLRRLSAGHTPTAAELELHAQGRRVPMPEEAA